MTISPEEFAKLSKLARLEFTPGEEEKIHSSLENFVGYLDKLKNFDSSGIKPLMVMEKKPKPLREDASRPGISPQDVSANAPDFQHGHFSIPKTVN